MKYSCFFLFLCAIPFVWGQTTQSLQTEGLKAPVEIRVDRWGIAHIYAENESDLFFAQGYNAARDRLFQFEVWRRQATGTVAELLGERELKRDIGTRLFQFRGNIEQEMAHYHPNGVEIITSFVRGVNAYIEETEKDPSLLPLEFQLLGTQPQKWTPEVVISRHQGLLGNIGRELAYSRIVQAIGAKKTQELLDFHPNKPRLEFDPAIQQELLFDDILELYNAYRRPVRFQPEDLVSEVRNDQDNFEYLAQEDAQAQEIVRQNLLNDIGSNNWIVNGKLSQSGYPLMANDPHRTQAVPSLRYMAHLVAPGWNVIGGGEPEIPGISIGHNEHGAWGLTVFQTDAEDLYVYEINPDNPNQYRYQGAWEDMKLIEDQIPVKGAKDPFTVTYKYTRHGPVVYEDPTNHVAYAVRCGWLEIGGSPYLASLRMDQAKSWEEFREACDFSHIPGENMIWADKKGNIGWQAVGIAPIRQNWDGLLPVPGDGRYEWSGYLPIKAKPHTVNPVENFFATANENVTEPGYPYPYALGFEWSDPYRGDRLAEVLASGRKHSMSDMIRLQTDYLSIPARTLIPYLQHLSFTEKNAQAARKMLLNWDFLLRPESISAGIYVAWEKRIVAAVRDKLVPENGKKLLPTVPIRVILQALETGHLALGDDPLAGRDALLQQAFQDAISDLTQKLGKDMDNWQYGQTDYKHIQLRHPMSAAVNESTRKVLEVGPHIRGGYSYTVNNTSGNDNQTHGASFRIIVDCSDWEKAVAMNSPGQSGDPNSKHYRNLFEHWAKDRFFPLVYSRERVEAATDYVIRLGRK